LAEVNEHIAAADLLDDSRVIAGRPITIGAAFAAERTTLMALPSEAFDPARLLLARVDKRARISVRQCYYQSTPAAPSCFQIITEREERASIAIATNLPSASGERCSGTTTWPRFYWGRSEPPGLPPEW